MSKIFENDKVNLGLLVFKLRRHWLMFAIIIPIVLATGFFYARSLQKVYGFKSSVLLNARRTGSISAEEALEIYNPVENRKINTDDQIGVITSYDMIKTTIEQLDFDVSYHVETDFGKSEKYGNFPFKVVVNDSASQVFNVPIYVDIISNKQYRLKADAEEIDLYDIELGDFRPLQMLSLRQTYEFGKPYQDEHFGFTIYLENPNLYRDRKLFFVLHHIDGLVKEYKGKLDVEPATRDAYLVEIRSQGTNAEKEITFLNKLMEVVKNKDLQEKNRESQNSLRFIEAELKAAKDSLLASEASLKAYRSDKGIINTTTIATSTTAKLDRLVEEKTDAELKLATYQNVLNSLRRNKTGLPSTYNINDQVIIGYVNSLANLKREKSRLSTSLTDRSPDMIKINREIEEDQRALEDYLNQNIEIVESNIQRYNRRILEGESQQTQLPIDDGELARLERQRNYNKIKYEKLLDKREEARIVLETTTPDIRIVEEAKKERDAPIKPNTKFIYLLSLVVGVGLPMGYILLEDILNSKIKSKENIKEESKVPLLGMVTHQGKKIKLPAHERPNSITSESFRALKLRLENGVQNSTPLTNKIIGVTSITEGEGKTFCAMNLAVTYANAGRKTVLIDADLYKNQIRKRLELEQSDKSLYRYLYDEDTEPYTIIHHHPAITNLDVIRALPELPEAEKGEVKKARQLVETKMQDLLRVLRAEYECVVIDIPPVGYVSDYYALQKSIDINLFVVRYNRTDKKLLKEINEIQENSQIDNAYLVFNGVKFAEMYELNFKKTKSSYYSYS